jgi:hypothetical protein
MTRKSFLFATFTLLSFVISLIYTHSALFSNISNSSSNKAIALQKTYTQQGSTVVVSPSNPTPSNPEKLANLQQPLQNILTKKTDIAHLRDTINVNLEQIKEKLGNNYKFIHQKALLILDKVIPAPDMHQLFITLGDNAIDLIIGEQFTISSNSHTMSLNVSSDINEKNQINILLDQLSAELTQSFAGEQQQTIALIQSLLMSEIILSYLDFFSIELNKKEQKLIAEIDTFFAEKNTALSNSRIDIIKRILANIADEKKGIILDKEGQSIIFDMQLTAIKKKLGNKYASLHKTMSSVIDKIMMSSVLNQFIDDSTNITVEAFTQEKIDHKNFSQKHASLDQKPLLQKIHHEFMQVFTNPDEITTQLFNLLFLQRQFPYNLDILFAKLTAKENEFLAELTTLETA